MFQRGFNFKESSWPEFNEEMKSFVESQRDEVVRALSGRGQFRLGHLYAHYGVTAESWLKMTTEQRRAIISAFDNAKLSIPSESFESDDNFVSVPTSVIQLTMPFFVFYLPTT